MLETSYRAVISLSAYELETLKTTLMEEIDRNGDDYPDINKACENILEQIK